jgi:hypothetical protein
MMARPMWQLTKSAHQEALHGLSTIAAEIVTLDDKI